MNGKPDGSKLVTTAELLYEHTLLANKCGQQNEIIKQLMQVNLQLKSELANACTEIATLRRVVTANQSLLSNGPNGRCIEI